MGAARNGTTRASVLTPSFFGRDVVIVARELLGKTLRHGGVKLRITETEAYRWPGDSACHARSGRTARNEALWGPAGQAYVYLCYGLHSMLNVVTGAVGEPAAVLIRACEPVAGLAIIRRRRQGRDGPELLRGPGRVGQALGLSVAWSRHPLYEAGGLSVCGGPPPPGILVGPRVGIDYAQPEHRVLPWRFASAQTPWVSHPRSLRPAQIDPFA